MKKKQQQHSIRRYLADANSISPSREIDPSPPLIRHTESELCSCTFAKDEPRRRRRRRRRRGRHKWVHCTVKGKVIQRNPLIKRKSAVNHGQKSGALDWISSFRHHRVRVLFKWVEKEEEKGTVSTIVSLQSIKHHSRPQRTKDENRFNVLFDAVCFCCYSVSSSSSLSCCFSCFIQKMYTRIR